MSKLPTRLHHNAYVTKDQEKTRQFYEEVIGLPLTATWCETDELFGKGAPTYTPSTPLATAGHSPSSSSPIRRTRPSSARKCRLGLPPHCAPGGYGDARHRSAYREGRHQAACHVVLEHGYCRSVNVTDPNGLILEFTRDPPEANGIPPTAAPMPTSPSSAGWPVTIIPTTPIVEPSEKGDFAHMSSRIDRIATTHVGSLPRSQAVTEVVFARETDASSVTWQPDDAVITAAVAEVVSKHQKQVGIDFVSDGEMSKISYATYIAGPISGFGGDSPRQPGQDLVEFPALLRKLAERGSTAKYRRPR